MSNTPSKSLLARRAGTLLTSLTIGLVSVAGHAGDAMRAKADETGHTEAAVLAVEDHWEQAEGSGDLTYIEQLLLPEYRSVGSNGSAHAKADILAHAAKNRGSDKGMKEIEAYLKAHPIGHTVVMSGDVAIVSFYDPALGPQKGVRSSDIFVYRNSGWHAVYSQHTEVGKS
ncbi:nuclear transport factor 2 family protein [Dyella subtropica]|uniref:nuclear transport factor 2 family protein n=1 Tax=Dyella subtropica TaxID=2992127 RepID=UPI0022536F9A|nr:nuclear transport factor 2 family protein [Dyella subtropica]